MMGLYIMRTLWFYVLVYYSTIAKACPREIAKVIVDTDTAMWSRFGMDIDDDLAVAYLYAHPCVEVIGVTVTHANAMISTTCHYAKALIEGLYSNSERPPVVCGSGYGILI